MKKSDFRGVSDVFRFTFLQAVKSKSFVITMIVMVIFAIALFPVMGLLNGGKSGKSPIETVYVDAQVKVDIPFNEASDADENFSHIKYKNYGDIPDGTTFEDKLEKDKENAVILSYELDEMGGYKFKVSYSAQTKIDSEDADAYADLISEWFNDYKIRTLNVSKETVDQLTREIVVEETEGKKFVADDKTVVITQAEYNIVYAMLFIAYMIIIMSANMVSSKIVEEKTNRIVEYLMTTVRPMALILGKIAAMLLVTIGQLLFMLGGALIGKSLAKSLFGYEVSSSMSAIFSGDVVKALSVPNLILCILIIGVGILIYSLISGLFGATVSKMDELQQGMKTFQVILIASFFAAFAAMQMMWTVGINGFVKLTLLFPSTSVFVLPGAILVGKTSAAFTALSIAIMLVTAIAILYFVGLVYESIIVMNGAPLSLKQIIAIAKGNKKNVKSKEGNN